MFLINHFLDKIVLGFPAPDPDQANTTNAVSGVGSLGQQVANCQAEQGRVPNFMLVDVSSMRLVNSLCNRLTTPSSVLRVRRWFGVRSCS